MNRRHFLKRATGLSLGLAAAGISLPMDVKAKAVTPITGWVADGYLNQCIRQNILQIKSEFTHLRLGETHCHSLFSDGNYSVSNLMHRASYLGLDFLIITEHHIPKIYDLDRSLLSFRKRAKVYEEWDDPKLNPIQVYPAIEISTQQGHLILVFPEEYLKSNHYQDIRLLLEVYDSKFPQMADAAEIIRTLGGVSIIPHPEIDRGYPFGAKISFIREHLLGLVDAIEDISTGHGYEKNFGEQLNLASIGSSDDHFNILIGTTATAYDSRFYPDFISAVRAKETQAIKVENSLHPFIAASRLVF